MKFYQYVTHKYYLEEDMFKENIKWAVKFVYYDKGRYLDTVEKIYMWKEAMKGNQLNDEHTVMFNKILDTVLKRKA